MTKRETTSLLVKLMGIYCLVQFAPSLTYILSFLGTIRDAPHVWIKLVTFGMMIIFPMIWIGFCIFIIRKSDKIAQRLYCEDSDASQLSSLGFQEVQILGYNFIGVILLVQTFPQVVSLVTTLKAQQVYCSYPSRPQVFYLNTLPRLLSFLTQFILGLILFLKPNGVANLWKKAQGMKSESLESDNKASEATSEPALNADSSSPQG